MYDKYGTKQIYLVQPTKLDYEIPQSDAIKTINEGRFRTYSVCDKNGVQGFYVGQMNRVQAERFAKNNNLELITDYKQDELLENFH